MEVEEIITKLKNKPSVGVDGISTKFLEIMCEFISEPLAFIINMCLSQGIFPDALKTALVVPVYKKNEHLLKENYRPIAILSTISKVIERVVSNQMLGHIEKHNIFTSSQHGFRNGRST